MLQLRYTTPSGWTERVKRDLAALLVDHAHLEKKAAGTATTLLFRYPDAARLQLPLADLAAEELSHFRAVVAELDARGWALRRQRASPYAGRLHAEVRSSEPERLLDTLLVAALIEARSCERFALLAEAFRDSEPSLANLYGDLRASEARHHGVYTRLAAETAGEGVARTRLAELADAEARVVRDLIENPGPVRLHS